MDCRLLAVVPLNRYGIMGGDIRRPIMQPISKADASQEYIALTKQGIAENMDFRSVKRVLKDWQLNQAIPACGVTEVTMTSKKAKAIFQDDPHHIRNAIADFYTMAYQQASGEPVILPMTSVKFVEDVHRSMYEGVLRGDSGTLNLAMAKPAHPIVLDVSGAASKVLQRSDRLTFGKISRIRCGSLQRQDLMRLYRTATMRQRCASRTGMVPAEQLR